MILFLTMTPAQLMNAYTLARTVFACERCDLYYTENLNGFIRKMDGDYAFENKYQYRLVDDITDRSTKLKRAVVRIKNALDISKIKKTLPSDPRQYSVVFASGISLRNYEIYYAIRSINKDTKLYLYEEGICEYCNLANRNRPMILFSKLFFHRYYMSDCRRLYVYEPAAVEVAWDNIEVCQIPRFADDPELLSSLNRIFDYRTEDSLAMKGKIVFLESAYYDPAEEEKQKRFVDMTVQSFGNENVVIKMHPRSPKTKYGNDLQTLYSGTPIEILAANMDLEDMMFISIYSSSVLNFKMMLGREPAVICLYKVANGSYNKSHSVFERVRKMYHYGRFYVPESEEEFIDIMSRYHERFG